MIERYMIHLDGGYGRTSKCDLVPSNNSEEDGIILVCKTKDVSELEAKIEWLEANPSLNNDIGEEPRTSYEQLLVDNARYKGEIDNLAKFLLKDYPRGFGELTIHEDGSIGDGAVDFAIKRINDLEESQKQTYDLWQSVIVERNELEATNDRLEIQDAVDDELKERIIAGLIVKLREEFNGLPVNQSKHELTSIEQEEEIAVLKDQVYWSPESVGALKASHGAILKSNRDQYAELKTELKITANLLGEKCEELVDLKRQVLTPINDENLIHVSRFKSVQKQRDWLIDCLCDTPEVDRLKLIARMEEELAKDKS